MTRRLIAGSFLALLLSAALLPLAALADTSGPNSVGTGADDATVGSCTWTNLTNAASSNNAYVLCNIIGTTGNMTQNSIKIVKGGSISGNEKSTGGTITTTDAYYSWGGSSDLWGLTWTDSDINASTFGVAISIKGNSQTSHYFKATNFGFSIPSGATINGILAEAEMSRAGSPIFNGQIDHVRITVTYTPASGGGAVTQDRSYGMSVLMF